MYFVKVKLCKPPPQQHSSLQSVQCHVLLCDKLTAR